MRNLCFYIKHYTLTVSPRIDDAVLRKRHGVAVAALGRADAPDDALDGDAAGAQLVGGVAQAQTAVATLPARGHAAGAVEDERAVLAGFEL